MNRTQNHFGTGIEAVITSFNQGAMILEAVESLLTQTVPPEKIIIVDDGSTDGFSLRVLRDLEKKRDLPVPMAVYYQKNGGVSSARNTGIRKTKTPLALVLDGDDKLKPAYIASVSQLLRDNPSMVAASSWMQTFGILDSIVRPAGGNISAFLSRNCCPATHILRRNIFDQCGGYDESMRSGFEDWDYFLSMLETSPESSIGMVDQPLIQYRTASASFNIKSMDKRLDLMRLIIEKHIDSYRSHLVDALLGVEATSSARLSLWESEVTHAVKNHRECSEPSKDFLRGPTYGDGGMASAVRTASVRKQSFTASD